MNSGNRSTLTINWRWCRHVIEYTQENRNNFSYCVVLQELVPHLEKVQVHTGLQNHPGVFLAIKNAFEPIDLEKGTHGEFLFYLKSVARIPFLGATLEPAAIVG